MILLLVMVCNAFFVASEMAIVSARRARLKQRVDEDDHAGAAMAIALAEDSGKFLSSVQIGITVLGIFSGAFGSENLTPPLALMLAPYVSGNPETWAFVLVITAITYFTLVIAELVPKRLAIAHAEAIAAATAIPMAWFARIAAPFVWLLERSSDGVLRLLPVNAGDNSQVTEEEVKNMIAEGTDAGVFARAEQQMMEGVLRMGDRTVRTIMTPRPDVEWIDASKPIADQIKQFSALKFSRLPVARGTLDDLVGVVYAKDFLNAYLAGQQPDPAAIVRPPLTVTDTLPALRLVDLFRSTRQHIAIVVDEHGSVEGVVSATDLLATVTGTLPEAADDGENILMQRADGSWLADGMIPIDEVMAHFNLHDMQDENDDFHTLAGFALKVLGHLPKAGERFTWSDGDDTYTFEVIDMDGRRIDKMLIIPPVKHPAKGATP